MTSARGTTPARKGLFGLVCLCVLGLAAFLGSGAPSAGAAADPCPNAEFRIGASANLPDCRAYELVTPEDTGGVSIGSGAKSAQGMSAGAFDQFLASTFEGRPSVLFVSDGGALPGLGGTGLADRYQSLRDDTQGWTSRLVGPTGDQTGDVDPSGVSSDHAYSLFWLPGYQGKAKGSLVEQGEYWLRKPDGSYQPIGLGEIESPPNSGEVALNPKSCGYYIAPGGSHIVFSTALCSGLSEGVPPVQLLPDAPPSGTVAIYDRTPSSLHTVSLLPGEITPTQDAFYLGNSADGSVITFTLGGLPVEENLASNLYVRIDNTETVEVVSGPTTVSPAGVSEDGEEVFYVQSGDAFSFDTAAQTTTQITDTGDVELVNISADGSRVYFVSHQQIGGEGNAGEPNLYLWKEGGETDYIVTLDPADLTGKPCLTCWTSDAVSRYKNPLNPPPFGSGPGNNASRTTPDGSTVVFESQAQLTAYDNEGHDEIYRYDTGDQSLFCVSCHPDGDPPASDASLQTMGPPAAEPVRAINVVANLTSDGQRVFFQTSDALVTEDISGTQDVYQWVAEGTGGCEEAGGCVSLLSSGQSPLVEFEGKELPTNRLYAVSPDGKDVFILVKEQLLPQDKSGGSGAIYDVRVNGGFPIPDTEKEECEGDGCQGEASGTPNLSGAASIGFAGNGNVKPRPKLVCGKGKRKVRRAGKARCVKRHSARAANANRGGRS